MGEQSVNANMLSGMPANLTELQRFVNGQFDADNIEPAHVHTLVMVSPVGAAANFICSTLCTLSLYGTVGTGLLAAWYAGVLILCAFTLYRYSRISGRKPRRISQRGLRKILTGSVIQALPWAAFALLFLGSRTVENQAVLFAVYAAGVAGGAIMLCRLFPAALAYTVTALPALKIKAFYLITVGEPVAENLVLVGIAVCAVILLIAFAAFEGYMAKAFEVNQRQLTAKAAALDRAEADMDELERFDPVTGLLNRAAFHAETRQMIARAELKGESAFLYVLDLDNFKRVNNSLGHSAGDDLLREAARRLKTVFPAGTLIARLGGDEFAVLQILSPETRTPEISSPSGLPETARQISRVMSEPFLIGGTSFRSSASTGVAGFPDEAGNAAQLFSFAEVALDRSKTRGQGDSIRFNREMSGELKHEELLFRDLQGALQRDELRLYYQPQIDLQTGTLSGFEALIRWEHPVRGTLSPGVFLGIAEKKGLILDICDRVFDLVARDLLWFDAQEFDPHRISVNIHASQIIHSERLLQQLDKWENTGVDPRRICLEVTEGCMLEGTNKSIYDLLQSFRNRGYRLSLDDFGTGYASLANLRTIPADEIKIDRSFVQDIAFDPIEFAIVESLLNIAWCRNLVVVAEGIEALQHVTTLQKLGCPLGQGFYFSKPVSRTTVVEELRSFEVPEVRASAGEILGKTAPLPGIAKAV